jgi:hypothetical protein
MPGKNVNLSVHKMSWHSRSKLHTCTHTHTHTQLECTLKKRKKNLIIPRGLSSGMVNDASVLLGVSLFGTEFFVITPLTSVVAISQEKLNLPNSWGCLTHFHIAQHFRPTPWTLETQLHPKRQLQAVSGSWSREVTNHHLHNPGNEPQEMLQESKAKIQDTEAV